VKVGIVSLLVGLGLYIGAAATRLSAYSGADQPSWLTTMWIAATVLLVLGLLVLVNDAVRAYRERS
jgi:hypothetical protein